MDVNKEGMSEGARRRGRIRKQLLDDLKEKRRYWKLSEETLGRTLCRIPCGRNWGPLLRQTTWWLRYLHKIQDIITEIMIKKSTYIIYYIISPVEYC